MSETAAAAPLENVQIKGRSPWREAGARLLRSRAALASFVAIAVILLVAALGPALWPHKAGAVFRDRIGTGASLADGHWLGVDIEGHDVVARLLLGLGVSWLTGALATFAALFVGVLWGGVAGLSGGGLDVLMTRIVRGLTALPLIFFVILVIIVVPVHGAAQNLWLIAGAVGALQWFVIARVVRNRTSALRGTAFVEAARAAGATRPQIVLRHIIPNIAGDVAVLGARTLSLAILMETFLSFLGLGVKAPLTSLGALIAQGAREMESAPWTLLGPSFALVITLIALRIAAGAVRDALAARQP